MKVFGQDMLTSGCSHGFHKSRMEIWEADKLLLFLCFVIPGFVSLKTYDLVLPSAERESTKRIVDAVAYSCINYALLLWPMFLVEKSRLRSAHPLLYEAFYVFALLVVPALWAVIFRFLRLTSFAQRVLPHPTTRPWDYVFSRRQARWVIVTMKDGKQVAGRHAFSSFASSAPAPEHLYLEEVWVLNAAGGFERPRENSAGILILTPDIVTVELFKMTFGGSHDGQQENR